MTGLDTGFFIELMRGHSTAVSAWKSLVEGEGLAVVSCLSMLELEQLGLKGIVRHTDELLEAIQAVCLVKWIEKPELLSRAATLSDSLGLSTIEALVFATFLNEGVNRIYTTNRNIGDVGRKEIEVVNLRHMPGPGSRP